MNSTIHAQTLREELGLVFMCWRVCVGKREMSDGDFCVGGVGIGKK